MSTYSIKDLEQLSGIKAHTLRIWEQRYQFISPKRTETNIRYYDSEDLKLILNVALLKDNGYKISKIATLGRDKLNEIVLQLTEKNWRYPDQINALLLSMIDLNQERFEEVIASNSRKIGFEATVLNVIYPFLSKIGVLWQTDAINPAQEHFVTNLIRQKIIVALDGLPSPQRNTADKYLFYLPEGELHELTLLFANYIVKARHNRAIYFGQNLPFDDVINIYGILNPEYIVTVITTSPPANQVQDYVHRLAAYFPKATILLSGYQVLSQDIKLADNVTVFHRIEHMIDFVEANSAEAPPTAADK
ncbi:MAG: MerR family transcriptional regulator [Tunicatimonas sp.]